MSQLEKSDIDKMNEKIFNECRSKLLTKNATATVVIGVVHGDREGDLVVLPLSNLSPRLVNDLLFIAWSEHKVKYQKGGEYN